MLGFMDRELTKGKTQFSHKLDAFWIIKIEDSLPTV